jgi:hypothetical protein
MSKATPAVHIVRRAKNMLLRLTHWAWRRMPVSRRSPQRSSIVVDTRPVHVYVALEPTPEELQHLLSRIARQAGRGRGHIPVIFTDSTDFAAIANTGAVFEYLPDRQTWRHHRPDWPWHDFARERLAEVDHCYRPRKTIVVASPDDVRAF